MSYVLARLLCVAAVTALALPVCAQTPQAEPKTTEAAPAAGSPTGAGAATSPTTAGAPAVTGQDEKTARAACEFKPAAEKEKCLKDVEAKYGKMDKMAPSGDMGAKPKEDTAKSGSYK
jgi:hypothetical protein